MYMTGDKGESGEDSVIAPQSSRTLKRNGWHEAKGMLLLNENSCETSSIFLQKLQYKKG